MNRAESRTLALMGGDDMFVNPRSFIGYQIESLCFIDGMGIISGNLVGRVFI
jgi:hypothetical protein